MRPTLLVLALVIAPAAFAQSPATAAPSPFLAVPVVPDALQFGAELPDFVAKDIRGRVWRSGDLRRKYTVIYIWHTFEARATDEHQASIHRIIPALPDLPEVQRFYDEVKDVKNIQVLTFCRDYDYTHAPAYMKERNYTFPVIADWELTNKLFPNGGRYLVVSPEGRVSRPFHSWSFGQVLFEVEKTAGN
ncbi:MAG TPA: hypothetical protein VJ732_00360 [Bryobacteraceae bacterium]|nr:hypothetical protein [Bryobacteraceae bacterium]